ncbi:MAG: hypothetical protein EHM42_04345 [Planctomycetaceae bacterium]|nr:MAG: hypothetical protein EHM42_04345 [Planctomycetaceae bacterium]
MILIAASVELLLPTIRSRCQVLPFQPLAARDVKRILARTSDVPLPEDVDSIIALCEGSLITANQLLDPELRRQRQALYEGLSQPRYDSLKLVDYAKSVAEGTTTVKAGQRSQAGWMIRFCIEFYRQSLLTVAGADSKTGVFPEVKQFLTRFPQWSVELLDRLAELLDRCLLADRQIEGNASLAICLEALFDDLGKLLREPIANSD